MNTHRKGFLFGFLGTFLLIIVGFILVVELPRSVVLATRGWLEFSLIALAILVFSVKRWSDRLHAFVRDSKLFYGIMTGVSYAFLAIILFLFVGLPLLGWALN